MKNKHGHIVIAQVGDKTLLKYGNKEVEPYVIVTGYDEKRGDWYWGKYFKTKKRAVDTFEKDYSNNYKRK